MDRGNKIQGKTIAYIAFGVYMMFLCWVILFKLADSVDKIPSMRGINLIPFYYDQLSGTRLHLNEVLDNVLVFVPAGYYFTAFGKGRTLRGIAAGALLSLSFEVLQWIFSLGASDITDLITNTAGAAAGALMFLVLGKLFKERQVKIVSIIGIVLEALCAAFLASIFIANS